jgi:glutathione peroxidase
MIGLSRRLLLAIGGAFVARAAGAAEPDQATQARTAWEFSFPDIDGGSLDLARFRGRVLLVVNTASFCGYTYQYKGLQQLNERLAARGLTVIGVPSGDFFQESGSNEKVKEFCDATFNVGFPMAAISQVRGAAAAPFYRWVRARRDWQPTWNFNKVLIGRDGAIRGTYRATVEPDGAELTAALEAALAQPVS